ncbi:MAG: hypothetical protein SPE75_06100 [Prevotella sp.]|nr:hypothetical protein [Prevotella sp.]
MKKHLLIALCMAVSASCLAQQPSNTRLLKEESKAVLINDKGTSTSSGYREYIYDKNGWPVKQTQDGEDYYYYDFELNSAGYATKVATYNLNNAGAKHYKSRIDYAYNADNKVEKKTIYALAYPDGVAYGDYDKMILKPKTEYFYEYDSDPEGFLCERREYDITNDRLSYIDKSVWLKDTNCYIGHSSIKQRDYEQISLDYDPAQLLFTEKFYKKDKNNHIYLYQHNLYSFYNDGKTKETLYQQYDEDGNLYYVSGNKFDVTKDAATNMFTVVTYSPQIENGAVSYIRSYEYKASANLYYGLPLTYENGNRYYSVTYPNEDTTESTWLAPNILLIRGTNEMSITYTNDKGNKEKKNLEKSPDGTYTAYFNVNTADNDNCDKIFVYDEQKEKVVRMIRINRKGLEYSNNYYTCLLEEKVGEGWKPFINNSVCQGNYLLTTDEQGRVKESRIYQSDGACYEYYQLTYGEKNCTSTLIHINDDNTTWKDFTDEYVVDGNITTNITYRYDSDQTKYPYTKDVEEKLNNGKDTKDLSYKYDRNTNQWNFDKGTIYTYEDMADGFVKQINYKVMADGSQVPYSKDVYKTLPEGLDAYFYHWDSDQNDWVGKSGYSKWNYPEATFKYNTVRDNLFRHFDPISTNDYLSKVTQCDRSEMIMNRKYIWDAATKSWKTKIEKGYELSENGKQLTYKDMKINDEGVTENDIWSTWKINDKGLLLEKNTYYYVKDESYPGEETTSETYQYDDYDNLLCETSYNKNSYYQNERSTTYIYGQIATGIGQATVGGLSINGRTFILNGAQLALYNTAGQCVATGIGQVTAPAPGVYVLKSGHMSWKMMMK